MVKKLDRRIVRTRAAMRKALIDLLIDTNYEKITITALAQKADIDRKTFYTHYSSIGDLFEDTLRCLAAEVLQHVDLLELFRDPKGYTKHFMSTLNNLMPLSLDQRRSVINHISLTEYVRCWTAVFKERITEQTGTLSAEAERHLQVLLDFYIGGLVNSFALWVQSDDPLPFEVVSDLISESVVNGFSGVMRQYVVLNLPSSHLPS